MKNLENIELIHNGGYVSFGEKFPVTVRAFIWRLPNGEISSASVPVSETVRVNPESQWKGEECNKPIYDQCCLQFFKEEFRMPSPFDFWNRLKSGKLPVNKRIK